MKEFFKILEIQGSPSTTYHPQTDGQTERANQEVEIYLRIFTNYRQNDWSDWLDTAEFALNDRLHTGTNETPFRLMYGFHPQSTNIRTESTPNPSVDNHLEQMKEARVHADLSIKKANAIMKTYYDRTKGQHTNFAIGNKVWLEGTNINSLRPIKKLADKRYGPFTILEKVGSSSYRLQLPPSWSHIHNVFNEVLLLPYHEPHFTSQQTPAPPDPVDVEGHPEYEVEFIRNSRRCHRKLEFLVHWKGWPDEDDTWESSENLTNAPQVIKEFYDSYPRAVK